VDISRPDQKAAFDLYRYDIPVVTVNGEEVARHKLVEKDFLAALGGASDSSHSSSPSHSK
jgi:hypothetical protein